MITPESIDRVREAADIVEIVGEHVKLRRTGADFRGPCPFHNGKGPNFSVSPRRNAYHCFVCHASGDVFSFVRERLGLDFVDAVKYVAARAGVEVQESAGRRDEQTADPREPLWEALAAAAEFFRDALWTDDDARAARDYLASRGIAREAADRFALGYAPRDGARVRQHLNTLGHDDDRLVAAGLLVRREGEDEPRTRFWGRLMFPILDTSGRHVGFGGRVIGQGEPKYLNSPESEVYNKGRLLYGLSWARHPIRKADRVLLVEGYFDAIRLALAGVEEVVAPLGTALTEQQAGLLARLTKNVFLLYDSDEAGQRASYRSGTELLRLGVSARVVSLPDGEDPDSFVQKHGAERLEAHLAQSVDIFERQVIELQRRGWFVELHRKRKAIDKLLLTLRATADELTRSMYAARLAEVSGVDRDALLREAAERPRRGEESGPGRPGASSPRGRDEPGGRGTPAGGASAAGILFVDQPRGSGPPDRQSRMRFGERRGGRGRRGEDVPLSSNAIPRLIGVVPEVGAEQALVQAMLVDRHFIDVVAERFGPGTFEHPDYRSIFERLLAAPDGDPAELADGLPEEGVAIMQRLLDAAPPNLQAQVDAGLNRLRGREIDRALAALDEELKLSPPDARKDEINAEKLRLAAERRAVRIVARRVGKAGF
jgi:DNA primase